MPIPIPEGQNIYAERKNFPAQYCMPNFSMATDHYNIRYIISGDRKTISANQSYTYHAGDVAMTPPFAYNRTLSESDEPYERYLIKFRPEFAEPFISNVGRNVFDELYSKNVFSFSKEIQPKVEAMFADILDEYDKPTHYKEFILQGMLCRLLAYIWENSIDGDTHKYKTPLSNPILEALFYVENNYNKNITLKSTAEIVHFSEAHFSRRFKAEIGIPFSEYLINIRIKHVQNLLIKTDKTVMEIALETGYCNGDYLSAQFKKMVGIAPLQFRQNALIRKNYITLK